MFARLQERRLARKAQTGMQRSHKKAHSNRDAERDWQHDFLQNHHKKMTMPHTIYADFQSLVRKVQGCKPNPEKGSVTVKTEQGRGMWFCLHNCQKWWQSMRANGLQRRKRSLFVSAASFARRDIDSRAFFNQEAACDDTWRSAAHYYTSLGLSWDALLNKTGVELELLTAVDMHIFFIERGMRGGIAMVSKLYAMANNPVVIGYNPSKQNTYIVYLGANNLYGWAMSLPLPKSDFKWMRVMPTEKDIRKKKASREGLDTWGGFRISTRTPQRSQQLPSGSWGKVHENRIVVGLPWPRWATTKSWFSHCKTKKYVFHYRNLLS